MTDIKQLSSTPYDDTYETCERALIELLIYGNELDPERISALLGLEPTDAAHTGDVRINSLGRSRVIVVGHWFLSSEAYVESKDLRRHIDWLVDKLAPRLSELHDLAKEPGVGVRCLCIWWSKHGDGGPTFWPEHLRALSELDVEVAFDVGFYGGPEGSDAE